MIKTFENSNWIWKNRETSDEYVEFYGEFTRKESGKVLLNLSADSVCNVYVNDKLVFFKLCSDYPHYKLYDSIDITEFCQEKNTLRVFVWYYGEGCFTYYPSNPGLIFEITQNQNLLLVSNENVLSRQDVRYKNGYKKLITLQVGYSFFYDNTIENSLPFEKSVVVDKTKTLNLNPLKPLALLDKTGFSVVKQTENSTLIDLGREEAGFLALDINSSIAQTVTVAYGEHIADGKVRQKIGARDFSVEIKLKKGDNRYQNTFRRIAGRYLEIKHESPLDIEYLGLIPVVYPVTVKPYGNDNELLKDIYDVSVRTLTLCMHEHYEDCPWREQSMYIMDSRNQMLCGYYAFGEFEFARQNLILMSKGLKDDGLLELTYPSKGTPSIPFFNLAYPIAVNEYIKYSKDATILDEVLPIIEKIISYHADRIDKNGLLATLPYPYWNFYEWSEGSHNDGEIERKPDDLYIPSYDLIFNCAYILAVENYCQMTGENIDLTKMRKTVRENFYDKETGLFFARLGESYYTELGNALAILSDVAIGKEAEFIAKKLTEENQMVEITLSMTCFKYDALLKVNKAYDKYVIDDLVKTYSYMLENGGTTFWETIKGEADFDGAGSLCHGWSAMPIYYFKTLLKD